MIGSERACPGVAAFDLQRRVLDAELVVQQGGCPRDESVARMPVRHHEVAGESRLCRAHRPDVKIMNALDAVEASKAAAHLGRVYAGRHGLQGEIERLTAEITASSSAAA